MSLPLTMLLILLLLKGHQACLGKQGWLISLRFQRLLTLHCNIIIKKQKMRGIILLFCLLVVGRSCPQNCQFCMQEPLCSACNKGYALTAVAGCIGQSVSNCRVQLNSTHCSVCEPTFQVSNGQCVKDFSGCVLRNSNGDCIYCWFGTTLTGKACSGVVNCQSMVNGKCTQCWPGYSLANGLCVENRKQCLTKQGAFCVKCAAKFAINGFSCLSQTTLPPFCSLFDYTVGRCLICNEGYESFHQYCQRKDYIPLLAPATATSAAQNALAMPTDTLDDSPSPSTSPTNNKVTRSDFIKQDYADIEVIVTIGQGSAKNQQSCWQFNPNGGCSICIQGYYLANSTCVKSSPQCLQFDSEKILCLQCRPQLQLNQGNCLDNNCAIPIFSRCSRCLNNFTPNFQGICYNSNCITLSQGACIKCANGFTLTSNNLCTKPVSTNLIDAGSSIVGCDVVQNGACLRCSANYFPNLFQKCKKVVIGCLKYDALDISCVQCISVYTLMPDATCVYQPETTPSKVTTPSVTIITTANTTQVPLVDPNCQVTNNGSCAICKSRYILNSYNFSCQLVPKECITFNQTNGNCLTCAPTFTLFMIWCLPRYTQSSSNCLASNINNYCTSCSPQFYNSRGNCLPINTECKTWDNIGGACLSCYSGYLVINGQCVAISKQPSCVQYDFQSNCVKCAQRYYLQAYICMPVNPLCNNYNAIGVCLDCVSGYGVSSVTNTCEAVKFAPTNCQSADPVGNCLSCSNRFYLSPDGSACLPVAALCSTYDKTGKCLSCYTGYVLLSDTTCIQKTIANGCVSADPTGICNSCSSQFVLSSSGVCNARDSNCLSYDKSGNCISCVSLYYLNNGKCAKQVKKAQKDAKCMNSDIMNYCIQCNPGYYISAGNCLLADQLCRTFDASNGNCLTCYDGYRLNVNKCYLNNPIFNCKRFNGSVCAECLTGYFVGQDGSCTAI